MQLDHQPKLNITMQTCRYREEFKVMVNELYHYSGSKLMFILLATAAFNVMEKSWKESKCAYWFWNSYVADPWGNWVLCLIELAGIHNIHYIHCIHVCCVCLNFMYALHVSYLQLLLR